MKTKIYLLIVSLMAFFAIGCGSSDAPSEEKPVEGTVESKEVTTVPSEATGRTFEGKEGDK
jgi:hypothetical protein